MTVLVSSLLPALLTLFHHFSEFIVTDLALASHSITSLTLSSATLLSPVLESNAPSAIITHAFFLPQLLELIYETEEKRATEYVVVVVGEPTPQAMSSVASNIKILSFANLEREGVKVEKVLSPLPSRSLFLNFYIQFTHILCYTKNPAMYSQFLFTNLHPAFSKVPN
jgi:long-chain acyl-CoA synthetase